VEDFVAMKRFALVVLSFLTGAGGVYVAGLEGQPPTAPAVPRELTSFRDVVKKVLPAVVSIESKAKPKPRRGDEPAEEAANFGSGFLVDAKGVVLTCAHVVEGSEQVEVTLRDGRKFQSKEIKSDPKTDLAIVRIEAKNALPFLELGDSNAMEIGDRVLAVGAPFGLTGSVTAGIISAKDRSLRLNQYEDFLQTDAAINPGNSGGPLINLEGKVIGVNSAIKSRSGGFQGVGLAIASDFARNVMQQLLKDGVVKRGYLGLQMRDVEGDELAARLGLKEPKGVIVTTIFGDTPAAKGGVQEGDVITSLSGKPIRDGRELQASVASSPLGKPIEVSVVRDGKPLTLKVTIEEQPKEYGTVRVPAAKPFDRPKNTVAMDSIGAEVADLTPEIAAALGFKEGTKGAVIVKVDRDGLAAENGLRRGMLIAKLDQKPVTSAESLQELLKAASMAKGVLLMVQSPQTGTGYVLLKASGS
jgi:serine protease Do